MTQEMWLRYDQFLNCSDVLIANNVFKYSLVLGTITNPPTVTNNHFYEGGSLTGFTGTTTGGTAAADFPGVITPTYTISDFTPSVGATIRSNLKAPVYKYDVVGTARGTPALLGAVV